MLIAMGFIVIIFVVVPITLMLWPDQQLAKCEDAIMETLKAPSTYKRINASGVSGIYDIEYDAENSFGTPLRSKGICTIGKDGKATWLELGR